MRIIETVQLSLVIGLAGIVIINWAMQVVDFLMVVTAVIFIAVVVIFFPPVFYGVRYQQEVVFIKQVGLMVLYEFTIILDSTKSIYDAVEMVVKGSYPYYSSLFRKAMQRSRYGYSLEKILLLEMIQKLPCSEISTYFAQLFNHWSSSQAFIEQFKFDMKNSLQMEMVEKNRYLGMYSAFYLALAAIIPPVLSILLILNNVLLLAIWIIFPFYLLVIFLGSPFSTVFVLARNWGLISSNKERMLRISSILSNLKDSMSDRLSFNLALVKVLKKMDVKDHLVAQLKTLVSLGFPFTHQRSLSVLTRLFGQKGFHFVKMYYRFVVYDEKRAQSVLTGLMRGARDIEQSIETVLKSIKAERRRFVLTLVITLFVMGLLTNMVALFKLISFFSGTDGVTAIKHVSVQNKADYAELLGYQKVFEEQISMGLYSLLICFFIVLYQPLIVKDREFMNITVNERKRIIFLKKIMTRILENLRLILSLYVIYCLGYVVSGIIMGKF